MGLTSRKARPLDRAIPHLRDSRLIIIAVEGKETEKQYFEGYETKEGKYFKLFEERHVQIKVLPTGEDNQSAPNHVLARLDKFKEEYQLDSNDELWLVVDVDRHHNLWAIAREVIKKKFKLAISNPCFEVWLLCHFQPLPQEPKNCSEIETLLRTALGGSYNKSNLSFLPELKDKINFAIQTAKQADINSQARWTTNVGTHVYKVVESIKRLK